MSPRHPRRRSRTLRPLARLAALAAPLAALPVPPASAAEGELAPASRPAAATGGRRVLCLPFAVVGDGATTGTMGVAVSETLATDLAGPGAETEAVKGDGTAADAAAAVGRAQRAGARYVVFGTVQSYGGDVRVSGQVVDVQSGGTVGTIRAAGPSTQFFAVQDSVVRQVSQAIGGGGPPPAAAGEYARPAPAAAPPSAPARSGSYWAEYMDLYEPVAAPAATPGYATLAPPQPPAPPLYGNGSTLGAYGGGGYCDYGYSYGGGVIGSLPYPIQLGTVRTQYFGQLGTSIIPPGPYQNGTYAPPAAPIRTSFTSSGGRFVYGTHTGEPISKYQYALYRYATPVGLPQRAAPPMLRPGSPSPAAASPARAVAAPAAKGR